MESSCPKNGEGAYDMQNKEKVGEGNFANAYRVTRKYDGLQCVAKILKNSMDLIKTDEEELQLVEREIEVMKQVDHPFHVEFIESFVNKEKYFCFITKFASGGNLTKLIKEKMARGGFSEKEALIYLA